MLSFALYEDFVLGDNSEHGRIGAVNVNLRLIRVRGEWVVAAGNPTSAIGLLWQD